MTKILEIHKCDDCPFHAYRTDHNSDDMVYFICNNTKSGEQFEYHTRIRTVMTPNNVDCALDDLDDFLQINEYNS